MRVIIATAVYPSEQKLGGAEVQSAYLAKGLHDRGHQVLFLATETGQTADYLTSDGLAVCELPGWNQVGHRQHRIDVGRAVAVFRPDLVYVRLLSELPTFHAVCRQARIPIVSVSCSMMETSPFLFGTHVRDAVWYLRSGQMLNHWRAFRTIKRSAVHVCNAQDLTDRISRWLGKIPLRTVYNGSPEPPAGEFHDWLGNQIIWVNNIKRWKRPELFVRLAELLPEYNFVMIGDIVGDGAYATSIRQLLSSPPANLTYLGKQPRDVTNQHIAASDLLVYTSLSEGFGNSFIQAWFRGVPTGSLTLPMDGVIERERLGFFAETFDEFVLKLKQLMEDPEERLATGQRARAYAVAHHSLTAMVSDYEALFAEVLDAPVDAPASLA